MPLPLLERRQGLPAAASALLLACLLAACNKDTPTAAPALPEVTVMPVKRGAVRMDVELPGRTAPSLLAEVRARVDGIVQERSFTEGSDVRAGQRLYQIDPAPYRTALASAQAALKRAQANLAASSAQLKRYQVLIVSNAVSKQDFDDAEAAQLQAAADVAAAEAAAANARINLGYTTVTAPIAGRSSISQVTKGAYVQGGAATLMTTVQQLDPMYVDLQQSSAEGLALRRDIAAGKLTADGARTEVKLQLEDGSTYAHAGTLEVSGVTVDPSTGSVTLRARFPNPDHLLLPGMFVRAAVSQGLRPNVVQVPAPAVTRNQKGDASVMLVGANGKTLLRPIRTGALQGGQWLVEDGLQEGERVIVSGIQKLKPDMSVKVRAATPASDSASAASAVPVAASAATAR